MGMQFLVARKCTENAQERENNMAEGPLWSTVGGKCTGRDRFNYVVLSRAQYF